MKVGKTTIHIKAIGCTRCGTEWASGWLFFKEIEVKIGNQIAWVSIYICDKCTRGEIPQLELRLE